ncbi:MAG: stage IV sporulation protein A, partial [Clostridia bacterium]|nr:stage IV sporulation protein A [Clostridia bacterium]
MEDKSWLYKDIVDRTKGAVYLGVVGPVRAGKSTFINKFMQNFVLPNIEDENDKRRAIDELPQAGDGTMIMTTKPQFVPNEAVKVNIDNVEMKVRLIDCVGYLIDGANGYMENDKPRLVDTPWSKNKIPFSQAATIGTQKVITEHSTIALVLTCDGSILDIPRSSYEASEKKIIKELKALKKPFSLIMNTKEPESENVKTLVKKLEHSYKVPVLALDVNNLSKGDVDNIMANV